ncbi:MAG TPA: NUDIX domain-containing protein [Bacillota bacterium]
MKPMDTVNHNGIKNRQGLTESEFLKQYNAGKYERPSVTVDLLIFTVTDEARLNYRKLPEKKLKLLLIKRGDHPFLGQWALPGGFVGINESVEEAAHRELREETNIDQLYMEQLYTWGEVNRDPRTRVISCSYLALADSIALNVKAGDDAVDARWFQVDYQVNREQETLLPTGFIAEKLVTLKLADQAQQLTGIIRIVNTVEGRVSKVKREVIEAPGIAFDHTKMIAYAIERLRNKLEYTDIAFNLMPERFTLSQLQQVYEVILGKQLLPAAFRRKIANMVQETGDYTKAAGHRPSKLYRFNPKWRVMNKESWE